MKTLIIIPTYNERENLRPLLDEIFVNAPQSDILVVDDNSPDGTGNLADQIAEEDTRVHVLHRAGNSASARPTSRVSSTQLPTHTTPLLK